MEKPMVSLIGIGQSSDPLAAELKMGKKQESKTRLKKWCCGNL